MFKIITLISFITLLSHIPLSAQVQQHTPAQQVIIEKYLNKSAYLHHYTSHEWTDYINAALGEDSTIALLWHHKALPFWKTMRYEMALASFDKAVQYSRKEYLARRGFLKCIFQKNYNGALTDLEAAKKEFGLGYENDHSYDFYIAICHLQLGKYAEAKRILLAEIERTDGRPSGYTPHYLELFFMGIIHYELRDYDKAIDYFEQSIGKYPQFSDAKYYKAVCYLKNGEKEKYHTLIREAKADYDMGLTISEDSRFYEQYPYQVNWAMVQLPK